MKAVFIGLCDPLLQIGEPLPPDEARANPTVHVSTPIVRCVGRISKAGMVS